MKTARKFGCQMTIDEARRKLIHQHFGDDVHAAVSGLVDQIEFSGILPKVGLPDGTDEEAEASIDLVMEVLLTRALEMVRGGRRLTVSDFNSEAYGREDLIGIAEVCHAKASVG